MISSEGRELAASKYAEDLLHGDHTAVYGSYYSGESGKWGYACCKRTGKHSRCKPVPTKPVPVALPAPTAVDIGPSLPIAISQNASPSADQEDKVAEAEPDEAEDHVAEDIPDEPLPEPGSEAAKERAAKAAVEVQRILEAPPMSPYSVLGLVERGADIKAVRRAHRQLVLLLHPDKNPDYADSCKEALIRVQEARELLEARLATKATIPGTTEPAEGEAPEKRQDAETAKPRERPSKRKKPARTVEAVKQRLAENQSQRSRAACPSAEAFIEHALLHCLAKWQASQPAAKNKSFDEVALAVGSMCQLLDEQALSAEHVQKLEQLCEHLLSREYVAASQVYLDINLGSKTWHSDVPTLLEGGLSWGGKQAGLERGQLYKQARTAQRLNSERKSAVDDEALKSQLPGLKRLLNMTQTLEPNADPSKNCL